MHADVSGQGGELALGHSRPVFGFKPIRHVSLAQGSGGDEGTSAAAGHFVAAACGYRFSTAAAAGGTQLLSCGLNTASCQLGHGRDHLAEGDEAVVPLLRLISPPSDAQSQPITMLACGFDHTVALTSQGCVLSWGERNSGQLGVDNDMCSRPQLVETLAGKRVVHVSAGGSHSLVVALPGDVWAFGSNLRGQLGNGVVAVADDDVDREKPVRVHLPDGVLISACAGGGLHSLALAHDGRIYSWGCNIKGQCGVNSGGEGGRDVLFPHLVHVSEIDELVASQGNGTGGWKMVSAGFSHSVALSHTGRVFTWGQCHAPSSDEGVSHVPIEMCLDQYCLEGVRSHSRVEWVAAAASHSVAVLGDRVVTWGRNKSQRREEPSPPRCHTSVVQHPVSPILNVRVCRLSFCARTCACVRRLLHAGPGKAGSEHQAGGCSACPRGGCCSILNRAHPSTPGMRSHRLRAGHAQVT